MKAYVWLLFVIFAAGCGDQTSPDPEIDDPETLAELEQAIADDLDATQTDADFTLLVESANGNVFEHSTGSSNDAVLYRSASTSKLVAAIVILALVEDDVLALTDHPQDYISTWPTTGHLSAIQLSHLLSFTSGLTNEPFCVNLSGFNFESCVNNIAGLNEEAPVPGTEFYYTSTHLQVAALMAVKASGLLSWQEVFEHFKTETGLFSAANFDLPSLQNPRIAGGMHWNAREYMDFLAALFANEIISESLMVTMTSDQITGVSIGYSPAMAGLQEDWHYGFGNWIECHAAPNNCTTTKRISSPGAYGAYPFIDYEKGYYGILAREGVLGSFPRDMSYL